MSRRDTALSLRKMAQTELAELDTAASASLFAGVLVLDTVTGFGFALDTILPVRATMGETLSAVNAGPTDY